MQIEGKEVLKYILERLERVLDRSSVMIATSDTPGDDAIAVFAEREGIACYRGSLEDVASRFYQAARSKGWQYAVRINGDNIFLDTNVLEAMIRIARTAGHDFISNVKGRTFPRGMSVEIVRLDYYERVLGTVRMDDQYQEHVTLYLYEHPGQGDHYYFYNSIVPEAAGIQLALDTPEDLARTREIISRFSEPHWEYNLEEIFVIWRDLGYE